MMPFMITIRTLKIVHLLNGQSTCSSTKMDNCSVFLSFLMYFMLPASVSLATYPNSIVFIFLQQ